jgi:hypothetical protein
MPALDRALAHGRTSPAAHPLSEARRPCKSGLMDRERARELRAVAPLVAVAGNKLTLIGPCTLVQNAGKTIAFSSADALRRGGEHLAIALTLDGVRTVPVASWTMGRDSRVALIELAGPFIDAPGFDVTPLSIGAVCASIDTRGAPSALVSVVVDGGKFARHAVPAHIDAVDTAGMSDDTRSYLATAIEEDPDELTVDGSTLFAWLPPDPVLGRPSEVVALALAVPYRTKTAQPRERAAVAELCGLVDLARALPFGQAGSEASNELGQIAGEIREDD